MEPVIKPPVDYIFPPVESGKVPYWRLVLRGFSQLCFQSNELTGLLFLIAVLIASPISAAYFLVAGMMAPAGRMLMGEHKATLETGLPGLNPGLVALLLPAFFHTGWTDIGMWAVLIICVAVSIVLVRVCLAILPLPTIALPFLIVFWVLYALAPHLDILRPITFGARARNVSSAEGRSVQSRPNAVFSHHMVWLAVCDRRAAKQLAAWSDRGVRGHHWDCGVLLLPGRRSGERRFRALWFQRRSYSRIGFRHLRRQAPTCHSGSPARHDTDACHRPSRSPHARCTICVHGLARIGVRLG